MEMSKGKKLTIILNSITYKNEQMKMISNNTWKEGIDNANIESAEFWISIYPGLITYQVIYTVYSTKSSQISQQLKQISVL